LGTTKPPEGKLLFLEALFKAKKFSYLKRNKGFILNKDPALRSVAPTSRALNTVGDIWQ
jgi:hypothetical protein